MVKVLFSFGDWEICEDPEAKFSGGSLDVWAKHSCSTENDAFTGLSWFVIDDDYNCYHCGESVPDEIQGLMMMLVSGYQGQRR